MEKARKIRQGEQGFTLIEIIAVLVILGILAAVAIPKYNDLQKQAQIKTAMGALPSLVTLALNDYHTMVMTNPGMSTLDFDKTVTGASVGDFVGAYTATDGAVTAQVTSFVTGAGPSSWFDKLSAAEKGTLTYKFTLP